MAASVGLGLLPGVGPRTIRRWLDAAGSAEAVWQMLPGLLGARADRHEVLAAWRSADPGTVVGTARAKGMAVIAFADPAYPWRLRAIPDPPPALYVRGRLDEAAAVAIVGSRRATPYGRAAAERLAYDLALAGVTVVSGLARGIDGAAHQAALDAGGRTVGVLGCGADVIYPREHRRLAAAVAASGALVSEFPPGTPPLPGHFPRRNRLISGLAMGVVVVEGTEDSGALVTVDYALDQGREVFAVPGSIFSPRSRAPHALLREGARVVERVEDILHELGLQTAQPRAVVIGSGDEARLLALLEAGPRQVDDLVEASGLPAARIAVLITTLEVRGLVRTLPGQMVMQTPRGVRR
ncbi:MAG: DNA-processing protein DprA [Armatimonadota bacterium]|nr:DNA-processing protein DprA [Armatimonadota bacterium]